MSKRGRVLYEPKRKCPPLNPPSVAEQYIVAFLGFGVSFFIIFYYCVYLEIDFLYEKIWYTFVTFVVLPSADMLLFLSMSFSKDRLWSEGIEFYGVTRESMINKRTFY